MFEEFVEAIEHAYTVKHVVHHIEPPQPLALFELSGLGGGKDRRRRIVKRPAERFPDQSDGVRLRLITKRYGTSQIDLRHRAVDMEQRFRGVEKHDSNRLTHGAPWPRK